MFRPAGSLTSCVKYNILLENEKHVKPPTTKHFTITLMNLQSPSIADVVLYNIPDKLC